MLQGYDLGLLLLVMTDCKLLYLPSAVNHCTTNLYTDDTSAHFSHHNPSAVRHVICYASPGLLLADQALLCSGLVELRICRSTYALKNS